MYTYEDLKKAPIGTKITFEKGEILVKDYYEMFENNLRSRTVRDLGNLQDNRYSIIGEINSEYDLNRIIKIEEPVYTTVYEVKDILDEKEKEYLSNVIKPFKDKILSIEKKKIVLMKNILAYFLKTMKWFSQTSKKAQCTKVWSLIENIHSRN